MKQVDFTFGHIEVEIDGIAIDLHNHFHFRSITYDVLKRKLNLVWVRNEYASDKDPLSVNISFSCVSHFSSIPRDANIPYSEDDCVHSIGYIGKNERTEDFYLLDTPGEDLHIVMAFHSGFMLRVYADVVECTVEPCK